MEIGIANLFASQNKNEHTTPLILKVKILTPNEQLIKLCATPELRLAGTAQRVSGNHSIIASCDKRQYFIQANISATGTWWQPVHPLKPGQPIVEQDIQVCHGKLDNMPADVIVEYGQIMGSTPTRNIPVGQPLRKSQLRKNWVIMAGKPVDVIASGNGFLIHTTGTALKNAALNETLRIHTVTGKLLTVTATGRGTAVIKI
ncbi:flagellar basal body P-ring formation protein FlgA [Enterobacter pasteurii]|uniref:flagellar basal body P-ring formation chaperone FlgA n=1 Tax=Enterobacter pasteurii TaxID=3029761 RepID=UPI00159D435C|nr:flagellar basal body P-ring formation chaperone FlgA [Enterobacter pasteurii]QLA68117.1 flagellar basal body P-ring formation protein FlgA [Enterobacter pasteurii]